MNKDFIIKEGIGEDETPDLKYYAFDWDDNILQMPTKIILKDKDGDEVGMSTEDYAKYRHTIGIEPFDYEGHEIIGYSDEPYKYFGVKGNKQFIIDSLIAKPSAAWGDFVEAINSGSIFSIITARGHNPEVLKESVYNLIISNKNGINSNQLIKSLEKYRNLTDSETLSKKDMIREYLELCKFYPVTFGQGSAAKPEELKVQAMKEFIQYVKEKSSELQKKAYLKNKVSNKFVPQIGFSDDDLKNLEKMKKHFKNEPMLKTYSTHGGIKKKY
jgi:hypothetical protein